MGWYVDRQAFRESLDSPTVLIELGFSLGKASESTMLYAMLDNTDLPKNRWEEVRERDLILNILSMATAYQEATQPEQHQPDGLAPSWWADQSIVFAARSLRLLDVSDVRNFQSVFENQGWDLEYVDSYKSDEGSLRGDLVTFVELALEENDRQDELYGR